MRKSRLTWGDLEPETRPHLGPTGSSSKRRRRTAGLERLNRGAADIEGEWNASDNCPRENELNGGRPPSLGRTEGVTPAY
ncbi:hypothetical protein NDU88_007063 [Pleurodeles waltl]|uniref:Uncharacterized protein n=1 Tax=Pleurodeles waltl TaxID=8319 RepID=A0AAV7PQB0_PLEWA|nr:hypothetical protein NDU88_007063 [Pleurodeles waltl]